MLVTHDRYMLDRVSTHVLGLDGDGTARVYADTQQWEQSLTTKRPSAKNEAARPEAAKVDAAPKKKLSYKEQREWDAMEPAVLAAEGLVAARKADLEDPVVATDATRLQAVIAELGVAEAEVATLYARWAELEARLA